MDDNRNRTTSIAIPTVQKLTRLEYTFYCIFYVLSFLTSMSNVEFRRFLEGFGFAFKTKAIANLQTVKPLFFHVACFT
jgi:hypothetical protein